MFGKIKSFFKPNNWKRWAIVVFSFLSCGLFIGLSLGLNEHNKLSGDYTNQVQLTVKPVDSNFVDYSSDNDELNNIKDNLLERLKYDFPTSTITANTEKEGIINLTATNINDEIKKSLFLNSLLNKESISLIDSTNGNVIANTSDFSFISGLNNKTYTLTTTNNQKIINGYKAAKAKKGSIVFIRNYELLKKIAEADPEFIESYDKNYYKYLFVNGITPEMKENASENPGISETTPVLLRTNLKYLDDKKQTIEYDSKFFLFGRIKDEPMSATLSISKDDIGLSSSNTYSNEDVKKEYTFFSYYLSQYNLNNYVFSSLPPNAGENAFIFLILGVVLIILVLSIFTILNYGFLGLISVLAMGVIFALSSLMITAFIGSYNFISMVALLIITIITYNIIISFLEKVKRNAKRGFSISKSIKEAIKETNKPDFIKIILLFVPILICYILLMNAFSGFFLATLFVLMFIPILTILFSRFISIAFSNTNKFKNSYKLISFLGIEKKINTNSNEFDEQNESIELIRTTTIENNEKIKIENSREWKWFKKINSKSNVISLSTILITIVGGLVTFISLFFAGNKSLYENGLNVGFNAINQNVLLIGKNDDTTLTNEDKKQIKQTLSSYNINLNDVFVKENFIEIRAKEKFSANLINNLTNSLWNYRVINSSFKELSTTKAMQFVAYGILVSIVAICLFVLFWFDWSKALTLLVSFLIGFALFVSMILFGLIQFTPSLIAVALLSFIVMVLTQLDSIISYSSIIRTKKIEELNKFSIKKIIEMTSFELLKKSIIFHSFICVLTLIALTTLIIPIQVGFFIIGFTLINFIMTAFFLPILLTFFESLRARRKRNKILNNYWETEKVKEQIFSGVNDIK